MIEKLNKEQQEVLTEFIDYVKNNSGIITVEMVKKQLLYDYDYGEGEAVELLNEHFYELLKKENLNENQISLLAKRILTRENKWVLVEHFSQIDVNNVSFDGAGYVILIDGTRIDCAPDQYKTDREKYNNVREKRLKKTNTNGIEFIKE